MKDKNLKYIAHAIIVVAFMGLIAFVIYYTGKTAFLWLLLFVLPVSTLGRLENKQEENTKIVTM